MGFLENILGSNKPTQKNIDKLVQKVKERYAQPEYRREAMDALLAMNTTESLTGVMQRFTVVAQSPHWDEEEKRWLVDQLVEKKESAVVPLVQFLKTADHVAFCARALSRIVDAPRYAQLLTEALTARAPSDHRSTQGKAELVAALKETNAQSVAVAVLPYVSDHSDDVRVAAVDAIEATFATIADNDKSHVATALQECITDDARSARVLRATAASMARLKIPVDATKPLAPSVAEDFLVKDGILVSAR